MGRYFFRPDLDRPDEVDRPEPPMEVPQAEAPQAEAPQAAPANTAPAEVMGDEDEPEQHRPSVNPNQLSFLGDWTRQHPVRWKLWRFQVYSATSVRSGYSRPCWFPDACPMLCC